ncbi:hypothetical protein [Tardiphaga sp. OK246]|uniref:hypothetical protein n=1 Tax=Tardiphaga sp. OK246 TaxID=1855307 RepID=UPI0015957099|nr:hypothetical protein [Tardiphaga sp. OK246]
MPLFNPSFAQRALLRSLFELPVERQMSGALHLLQFKVDLCDIDPGALDEQS